MPRIEIREIHKDFSKNWLFFTGLLLMVFSLHLLFNVGRLSIDFAWNELKKYFPLLTISSIIGLFLRYSIMGWIRFKD